MAKQIQFESSEEMADVYDVVTEVQTRMSGGESLPEALQNIKFLEDMDSRGRVLVLQVLAQVEGSGE